MVATFDVDLRPGRGLGMFEIGISFDCAVKTYGWIKLRSVGTSLWTIIDILRHNTTLFPRIEIKYDAASESALSPILLHINPHLDLLFTGQHQRLRTIALRRLTEPSPPVTLTYKDVVLLAGSDSETIRRSDISKHFGPTYPGESLHYPGVSFLFDDDGLGGIAGHNNDMVVGAIRVGSPGREDRQREVKRIVVSQIGGDGTEADVLDEVTECESMVGDIRQAIVKVSPKFAGLSLLSVFIRFMIVLSFTSTRLPPNLFTFKSVSQVHKILHATLARLCEHIIRKTIG